MILKITQEKVLEAASKCSTAKDVLKTLFPEAFKQEVESFKDFNVNTSTIDTPIYIANGHAPEGLGYKCFGLSDKYDWRIVLETGRQILIPTIKPHNV